MKTFNVPGLPGENYQDYVQRVSGLAWQFSGERALQVSDVGLVTLDGDQPDGAGFEEVQQHVG